MRCDVMLPRGTKHWADISYNPQAQVPWWLWMSGGLTRCQVARGVVKVCAGRSTNLFVKFFLFDGGICTATWQAGDKPEWTTIP